MSFGIVATVGGAVIGGVIAAEGAQSAAETQAAGGDRATAAQERQFNQQLALQEPWRQAGMQGLNALLQYTGLQPQGQAIGGSQPALPAPSPASAPMMGVPGGAGAPLSLEQFAQERGLSLVPLMGQDQQARQAYDQYLAQLAPAAAGAPAGAGAPGAAGSPALPAGAYGSLLTPYPAFKPFSEEAFKVDPGYQFRLEQGENGLYRAAAASHQLQSGKYLKDAMRFNSGLGAQEYGAAYGRYNADQLTGYNQYNANQTNIFNRLASLAGIGQTAANAQTAAAGQFGSQIGSNILGSANVTAAGQVGTATALNNAIGQGTSLYQQNRLMDRVYPQGPAYTTPPNPYYGQPTVQSQQPMMDWYS